MKILTVTKVARNFSAIMDDVERGREEIILVRDHKTISRLVPEPPTQTALEVLGDLYRTLDDKTANALAAATCSSTPQTLSRLRTPASQSHPMLRLTRLPHPVPVPRELPAATAGCRHPRTRAAQACYRRPAMVTRLLPQGIASAVPSRFVRELGIAVASMPMYFNPFIFIEVKSVCR